MVYKNIPRLKKDGNPVKYNKKICLECVKEFQPMINVQKYCKLTCKNRFKRREHSEQIKIYNRMYAKKYPLRIKLWSKISRDKPESKLKRRLWEKNFYSKYENRIKRRLWEKEYQKELYNTNIQIKLKSNIMSRINKKIKLYLRNGKIFPVKYKKELNINLIVINLIKELPNDFYEQKYHIDHINPLCSFDLSDINQLKEAFSPLNHRWLLAKENMEKAKEDKLKKVQLI